jgi:hypothetical protein
VSSDGSAVNVYVEQPLTLLDAQLIVADLMKVDREEGAYFVALSCVEGSTETSDNRLANSTFAIGDRGAALSGLKAGTQDTALVAGATCP